MLISPPYKVCSIIDFDYDVFRMPHLPYIKNYTDMSNSSFIKKRLNPIQCVSALATICMLKTLEYTVA